MHQFQRQHLDFGDRGNQPTYIVEMVNERRTSSKKKHENHFTDKTIGSRTYGILTFPLFQVLICADRDHRMRRSNTTRSRDMLQAYSGANEHISRWSFKQGAGN